MDELLKLVNSLPMPALLVFAAVLGLIFGVRYLGLWQGIQSRSVGPAGAAQVAAVIVDPTALNHASAAVEGLTVAITESNVIARHHAASIDRLGEGVDRLRDEVIRSAAKIK